MKGESGEAGFDWALLRAVGADPELLMLGVGKGGDFKKENWLT